MRKYKNAIVGNILTIITTATIAAMFVYIPPSMGAMVLISLTSCAGYLSAVVYFELYKKQL